MENENKLQSVVRVHTDLLEAKKLAYEPIGLTLQYLIQEPESKDYGAYTFEMNSKRIKFRVGKITPTKIGHFVTLWKRSVDGATIPYDLNDPVDLFVLSTRKGGRFGQFVFPKTVLCEKGMVSKQEKGGKRAMRIYPPWDSTNSRQAKHTQAWQLLYFFEIYPNGQIDSHIVKKLFNI